MNKRLEYLRRRRKLLVSQAAVQRSEVAVIAEELQPRLRFVEMGFAVVQAIRFHPALATVSATLMLPAPKNKLLRWGSRVFTVWEVFSLARKQWLTFRKTPQQ